MGISIVSDTRIDDLSEGGSWITYEATCEEQFWKTGMYKRLKFRSYGTVGYGPTMWVKSRRSGDILHGYDSKACQRIAYQLCRQQHRYQGRGTKRTIFLLVETRQTNRQSSLASVVTGMLSTIVTGSYWPSCTPWCLHKQGDITAYVILITERLNKTMERKLCLSD